MALPKAGLELVAENYTEYIAALNRSTEATDRLNDTLGRAAGGATRSSEVMTGAFHGVGMAAVDMAAQAGGALVDFVGDSISAAGDFEAGMNRLGAVVGDSLAQQGLDLDDARQKALQLGADTQFSADQALEAMTELAKGGVPITAVMGDATDATLALAAAGDVELATAGNIVAKTLAVWADRGLDATHATDLLAQAANASTVDLEELAAGVGNAQGRAALMGVEYDDLVTTMALVSGGFSSAQQAGTSLNNFYARLIPQTNDAKAAMADLGLYTEEAGSAFFDQQGQFIGGAAAAELLQKATQGLTDEQTAAAYAVIFGNDAMGVASELTRKGAEGYTETTIAMEAAGTAAEQAAKMNQGFNAVMDALGGSFDTVKIQIGSAFLPVLSDLVTNYVTPAVNTFGDFVGVVMSADDPLQAVADLLGVTGGTAGALGGVVQELAEKHLTRLTDAWNQDVMPAVTTAQQFFQDDVLPILDDLGQVVLPMVDASLDVAAGVWENVLVPALKVAWAFLDGVLIPIVKDVAAWMADKLPPAIRTASQFFTGTLLPAVKTTFEFVETKVIPIVEAVAKVLEVTLVKALEVAGDAWELYLKPGLESMGSWLTGTFKPIIDNLATWLGSVTGGFQGIQEAIGWVLGKLAELATAIENLPDLPDVYTPGSPTPAELGFLGIAKALEIATPRVESFSAASAGLGRVAPDMQPSSISSATSYSYGGNTNTFQFNGADLAAVRRIVRDEVNAIAESAERRRRGGGGRG